MYKSGQSGAYRRVAAALLAVGAVFAGLLVPGFAFGGRSASATASSFTCQPGFYQVISGQLKLLNPLTGIYTNIGSVNSGYTSYNAMGYDVQDNYIYAISTSTSPGSVLKVAGDGTVTNLGVPSGLPAVQYISGDMDNSGDLIVQTGTPNVFYSINVNTMTATQFTVSGSVGGANDMVWINGSLYMVSGSTLYVVNLSTMTATSAPVAGLASGNFGAAWSDKPDDLFVSNNANGQISQITGFTGATPTATLKVTGITTSNNDGAACKQASSPFATPTATDDSYSVTADNTLSVTATDGVLANDQGTNMTAAAVTGPSHGQLTLGTDGSFTYTPTAGWSGPDSFTYQGTDQYNRVSNTATVTISVNLPTAPAAQNDSYSTAAGAPLTVVAATGVLANDSGTGIDVTADTQPADGQVTVNADGSFTYTPDTGWSGSDSFTYTVTDTFDRQVSATVDVQVTPVARADTYSATGGSTLTVPAATGVLANDTGSSLSADVQTGPSHGSLTLATDGSFSYAPTLGYTGSDAFTYTATDPSGQTATATVTITTGDPTAPDAHADTYSTPSGTALRETAGTGVLANDSGLDLSVTANGQPAHGAVSIASDGSFTYTPTGGYSGPDTVTYTATDAYAQTTTATVTVSVRPVAGNDSYSTGSGQTLDVPVGSGVLANDLGTALTITGNTEPTNGTVTINADGSFTYIPVVGYSGPDSFSYTATDGSDQTTSATVQLSVTPAAQGDTYSVAAGHVLTVVVGAGVLANDSGRGLTVTENGLPSDGTVSVATDGSFTYTPVAGFSGTDTFTYQCTDSSSQTCGATVTITVSPLADPDAYSAQSGGTLTADSTDGVLANDEGTGLLVSSLTQPAHGSVVMADDGSFSYTSAAGYSGGDSFTYTVTDGDSHQASTMVSVTVLPVAGADSYSVTGGATLSVAAGTGVLANDGGSALTAALYGGSVYGTLSLSADGSFTYTPESGFSGADSFTYTATDASGHTTPPTLVTISVGRPAAPVARPDAYTTSSGSALSTPAPSGVLADDSGTGIAVSGHTDPAHGTVDLAADGSFLYTPTAGYSGTDNFGYTVTDAYGQTANTTVTVTVTPVVGTDTYTSSNGSTLEVPARAGVLANDLGSGLRVTSYTQPAHGHLIVHPDGSFSYTPEAGYVGAASFTYTATDAQGQVVHGAVTLAVASSPAPQKVTASSTSTGSPKSPTRTPKEPTPASAPPLATPAHAVSSGQLPFTGTDTLTLVGAALGLIASGLLLLAVRRPRRWRR
ncbi:MAG TPA: Ig-like domain-containing protein [Acidimicrobiales bacterium]|jgi:hypothetical protein|nr:Ig-like domain-containing protein [Acidimicrobiales bacterium]